jgi:hypothetical protein
LGSERTKDVVILSGKAHLHATSFARPQQEPLRDDLGIGIFFGELLLNARQHFVDETLFFHINEKLRVRRVKSLG